MKDTLIQLSKGVLRGPAADLVPVLFGEQPPTVSKKDVTFSLFNTNLDHSQVLKLFCFYLKACCLSLSLSIYIYIHISTCIRTHIYIDISVLLYPKLFNVTFNRWLFSHTIWLFYFSVEYFFLTCCFQLIIHCEMLMQSSFTLLIMDTHTASIGWEFLLVHRGQHVWLT